MTNYISILKRMVKTKIIKNIYHKVSIHYLYWIIALTCILTGHFKEFVIMTIIITIHELGHIIGGLIYKWNIDKIVILPFGALTIFKEHINKPIKEELVILILGPLFQIFGYFFLNSYFDPLFKTYNYAILVFNLLPILPLDGSKLLNLLLNKITSFKKSYTITIYISIGGLLTILLLINNLYIYLISIFLIFKTIEQIKNKDIIFNKFLFERYIYKFNFKKRKKISKINNMKRDYKHIFFLQNKYVTEKEMLQKRFDSKYNIW